MCIALCRRFLYLWRTTKNSLQRKEIFITRKNDSETRVLGSSEKPVKSNCGGLKSSNFDVAVSVSLQIENPGGDLQIMEEKFILPEEWNIILL